MSQIENGTNLSDAEDNTIKLGLGIDAEENYDVRNENNQYFLRDQFEYSQD